MQYRWNYNVYPANKNKNNNNKYNSSLLSNVTNSLNLWSSCFENTKPVVLTISTILVFVRPNFSQTRSIVSVRDDHLYKNLSEFLCIYWQYFWRLLLCFLIPSTYSTRKVAGKVYDS